MESGKAPAQHRARNERTTMKGIKTFLLLAGAAAFLLGPSAALAQSCCVKAKAKGKDCDHPCCVKAHADHKTCPKCQAEPSCCDKAIAAGKTCEHKCCVAAAKEKKVCLKCNATKEDKPAQKKKT
jgi:hypothetical protein